MTVFAEKKLFFAANFAIDFNLLWTESRGVCSEILKMVECFCLSMVKVQKGRGLAFFQVTVNNFNLIIKQNKINT